MGVKTQKEALNPKTGVESFEMSVESLKLKPLT